MISSTQFRYDKLHDGAHNLLRLIYCMWSKCR